jgi:hypothetical protein
MKRNYRIALLLGSVFILLSGCSSITDRTGAVSVCFDGSSLCRSAGVSGLTIKVQLINAESGTVMNTQTKTFSAADTQTELSFSAQTGLNVYLKASLYAGSTLIATGESASVSVELRTEITLPVTSVKAVYVSGTGSEYLPAGSDTSGDGTFTRPWASMGMALSTYTSGSTAANPFVLFIDGTLAESLNKTLSQNMYVTVMPLSGSAVINTPDGIVFYSDTDTASYTADITFSGISFTGYTKGALGGMGSGMTLTVKNCTFTPGSGTAECSIEPVVSKFVLDGTNTFNGSPVALVSLSYCGSGSFITLGPDFTASAGSVPVYAGSTVSGSDTQKIIVKSDGTALTQAELGYFAVTPSSGYYLALSPDSLYAYLVGSGTAEAAVWLTVPDSTVWAVPYLGTETPVSAAGRYIADSALTASEGDRIYAGAVQKSGDTYSELTASSYKMSMYDTSGDLLSDTYTELVMDAATHAITLPSWMPAGTYSLYTAAEYNNFWYTKTYTVTVTEK